MVEIQVSCRSKGRSNSSNSCNNSNNSNKIKEDSLPDLMMVSDGSTTESIDLPGLSASGSNNNLTVNNKNISNSNSNSNGDGDGATLSNHNADNHNSVTALHSNTHITTNANNNTINNTNNNISMQPSTHTGHTSTLTSSKTEQDRLHPKDTSSTSSKSSSRRKHLPLQRTQSVPMLLQTESRHHSSWNGHGTCTESKPMRLSSFIQENRSPIPTTPNDGEDSTIEESWRPNAAQRIRDITPPDKKSTRSTSTGSASGTSAASVSSSKKKSTSKRTTSPKSKSGSHSVAAPTTTTKGNAAISTIPAAPNSSQLEGFLDSLLEGAAGYSRKSPGAGYRKRIEKRNNTSEGSVASNKSERRVIATCATSLSGSASINGSSAGHLGPGQEPSIISDDGHSRSSSITSASRRSTGLGLVRGNASETGQFTRSNSMSMTNSNPIAWTRKEPPVSRTANHTATNKERYSTEALFTNNEHLLSTFLDRESRHRRTSSAHTISGDPRVSIAISSIDGAKTFTVGPKEAQIIQQLLEASNSTAVIDADDAHELVDDSRHRHPATSPLSPTPMDPNMMVSHHEASTIAESERISTRSSLFVELSPPLAKHNTLTHYLDDRRGRRKSRSSAFTVAGDKVSVRFQGKSTSELVELLKEEKRESAKKPAVRPTKSGARHLRSDLVNMASAPDLDAMNAMHESIQFLGPTIFDIPSQGNAIHVSRVTRADLQSLLDGRSPNSNRRRLSGSHSVSGPGMFTSTGSSSNSNTTNRRSSSRQKSVQRNKSQELAEFEFTPSSSKPTNRRTIMRKMHSVPMLTDQPTPKRASSRDRISSSRQRSKERGDGRQRSKERAEMRSSSREQRRKRRETSENRDQKMDGLAQLQPRSRSLDPYRSNNVQSTTAAAIITASPQPPPPTTSLRNLVKSDSIRRSRKKNEVSAPGLSPKEEDQEQQKQDSTDDDNNVELRIEDFHKSFLDQFLDHDVEAHDSASQMKVHEEEYKASLREIPKDPKKVRSTDYKRVKTGMEQPSPRLALLYDNSSVSAKKAEPDNNNNSSSIKPTESSVNMQKNNQESVSSEAKKTPSEKKKSSKKSPKKKGQKVKIELVDQKSNESFSEFKNSIDPATEPAAAMAPSDRVTLSDLPRQPVERNPVVGAVPALTPSEKVTLSDLPRQRIEKTIDIPDTSGHARLADRIKILSNRTLVPDNKPGKLVEARVHPKDPEHSSPQVLHNASTNTMENQEELSSKTPRTSSEFSGWTKNGVGRPPLSSDTPAIASSFTEKNTPPTQPKRKNSRTGEAHAKNVCPGPSRLPPVTIAEGSVLEVSDDNSVCSDITDAFSWEPQEIDSSRRNRKLELGRIDESESSEHCQQTIGGTSWGDLSVSEDKRDDTSFLSRDKRMHVAKRWQSTPSLNGARQFDALRSPVRESETGVATETATPGRFDWLKKKMGIAKARKMS